MAMSNEGRKMRIPIAPHTSVTMYEKMTMKAYFDLTRLRAFIGEEKKSHTDPPSSPMIIVPNIVAIMAPGPRMIQATRNLELSGVIGSPYIPKYCVSGMRMKTRGIMKT